jgi:hypothetical protein
MEDDLMATYEEFQDPSREYLDKKELEMSNECYLIYKGVRSCAQFDVHGPKERGDDYRSLTINDILRSLEQVALRYNLNAIWFEYEDNSELEDGFTSFSFWVYRYSHQAAILRAVHKYDHGVLRDWIIGKLLGYSDASMEEYLIRNIMDIIEVDTGLLKTDKEVK